MSRVDKLLQDYDVFKEQFPDMCLVKKKDASDEYLPSYYVFTFYTNVSLVHLRADLNDDCNTYKISSQGQVLVKNVTVSKLRSKLESMKIQTGLTGAINSDYKITSFREQ